MRRPTAYIGAGPALSRHCQRGPPEHVLDDVPIDALDEEERRYSVSRVVWGGR